MNRLYIASLAVVVLLAGLCAFLAFSLFFDIREQSQEFIAEKKDLEYLSQKHEKVKKSMEYEEMEAVLERAYKMFGDPKKPIDTATTLKMLAERNDLQVEIDATRSRATLPWPRFMFEVEFTGSFPDALEFLREVETKEWLSTIENLHIEKDEEEILGEMSLKVYFLEEDEE